MLLYLAKTVTLNKTLYYVLISVLPGTLEDTDSQNPGEKSLPTLATGLCRYALMDTDGQIHYSLLCTYCVHNEY